MKKTTIKKLLLISVPLIAVILVICFVVIPKVNSANNDTKEKT